MQLLIPAVGLVVVGALAVAAGVALLVRERRLDTGGVTTPATVVEIVQERSTTGAGGPHPVTRIYYYAVVAYTAPDGRAVRKKDTTPHAERPFPVGRQVSVTLMPGDPENFRITEDTSGSQAGVFWAVGGVVAVLLGVVLAVLG